VTAPDPRALREMLDHIKMIRGVLSAREALTEVIALYADMDAEQISDLAEGEAETAVRLAQDGMAAEDAVEAARMVHRGA
jgi:hypothetical protein